MTHGTDDRTVCPRAIALASRLLACALGIWPGVASTIACSPRPHPFDAPIVRAQNGVASLTLTAVTLSDGRAAFAFKGRDVPPTILVAPGEILKIHYVNMLSVPSETLARTGRMNMSNLHFHGLSVSPERPQDDVLDMTAMPGESVDYTLMIPPDHVPGLFWYHTHPHGESEQQVLDGMSGALIVAGIERYVPAVRDMREQVLVVRALDVSGDPRRSAKQSEVDLERTRCGESPDDISRVFTVNGVLRPAITMRPGEQQFWRIVNAAPDRYLDIDLPGERLSVVAFDGLPVAYHDPAHPTRSVDHVLLPPGGRVEAIVTAPLAGRRTVLHTRCVDTGADGDPNPGMVLADVASTSVSARSAIIPSSTTSAAPAFKVVDVRATQLRPPDVRVTFTEGDHRFYINGHVFSGDDPPMVRAQVGSFQHWRIVNDTRELHPMHIHQAHFLAFLENDRVIADPRWLDTVNVPARGSVDVVMDFTDPVIRGMSVFHCHLLNHEDKGMMAKIFFE